MNCACNCVTWRGDEQISEFRCCVGLMTSGATRTLVARRFCCKPHERKRKSVDGKTIGRDSAQQQPHSRHTHIHICLYVSKCVYLYAARRRHQCATAKNMKLIELPYCADKRIPASVLIYKTIYGFVCVCMRVYACMHRHICKYCMCNHTLGWLQFTVA